MDVIPFVHEGLGNSSYLVGLGADRAILVDPDRSVRRYLQAAEARGWRIASVFETHVHADFVTGACEIMAAAGACVFHAHDSGVRYPHRALHSGERVTLEGAEVEVIASPGHTPEHTSYVLRTAGAPPALFSGGALTAGSAARTDLVSPDLTEILTRAQFHTIRQAFNALPDEALVYPTHGAGSFCTAGPAGERTSTLGRERAANPLLSIDDEEEFVCWFPTTFPAMPAYFAHMRDVNQAGPRLRRKIPDPPALAPALFQRAATQDGVIIDVRPVPDYAAGHILGSINISYREAYATWLGWLAPLGTPLLFVLNSVGRAPSPEVLERVIEESLLVGHERFSGWLEGGIEAWRAAGLPLLSMQLIDPQEARRQILDGAAVIDVREPDEYASGHIEGATHLPLGSLAERLDSLPRDRPIVTSCAMGERSTTAASLLERAGFGPLLNLRGGIAAWREAGQPLRV